MNSPRILFWDIETTHNVVAAFRLWGDNFIPHDNVLQERYIVCACWKWLGEPEIHTVSTLDDPERFAANPHDDFHVVSKLHEVLSSADVIVAHNGDSYDTKFFKGRALKHGLTPIPPVHSIDTKKVAKRHFYFNSNRLDYLGQYLGLGRKLETEKGLWLKVLMGGGPGVREKAITDMVRYNKGDIRLLEKVFIKMRPYMPDIVNDELWGGKPNVCPRPGCGGKKLHSRGTHKALTRTYTRYQCQKCGGWTKAIKPESAPKATMRML